MKKQKKLLVLAAAGLLASCICACSSDGNESTADTQTGETSQTSADTSEDTSSGETVTLRFSWWGNDARHEKTLKVIEMFQEQHPNIVIEPE